MQTEVKHLTDVKALILRNNRVQLRELSEDVWIEKYASGTLRKNKSLGMRFRDQYLHERVCWEYGYGFEIMPSSRVTFNDVQTEADCKPLTELGWHAQRIIEQRVFADDYYEVKYIILEEQNYIRREGAGLILRETTSAWIPKGYLVFSIIAEFDTFKKEYKQAINPC